jgi:hypothetical protein
MGQAGRHDIYLFKSSYWNRGYWNKNLKHCFSRDSEIAFFAPFSIIVTSVKLSSHFCLIRLPLSSHLQQPAFHYSLHIRRFTRLSQKLCPWMLPVSVFVLIIFMFFTVRLKTLFLLSNVGSFQSYFHTNKFREIVILLKSLSLPRRLWHANKKCLLLRTEECFAWRVYRLFGWRHTSLPFFCRPCMNGKRKNV